MICNRFMSKSLLGLGLVIACGSALAMNEAQVLRGKDGRQYLLHGYNSSNAAKFGFHDSRVAPNTPQPNLSGVSWESASDIANQAVLGNNGVRMLIAWGKVMPQPGVIDYGYLNSINNTIKTYANNGIQVLVDMHQDAYSPSLGGDGAPSWAVNTNGLQSFYTQDVASNPTPAAYYNAVYIQLNDPAYQAAMDNFWGNTNGLQDYYAQAWSAVAKTVGGNTNVIGYDLFNEPYINAACQVLSMYCAPNILEPFYQKVINSIRTVDQRTLVFVEPQVSVSAGWFSGMVPLNDTDANSKQRDVYAPHYYPNINIFSSNNVLRSSDNYSGPTDGYNSIINGAGTALFLAQTALTEQTMNTPAFIGEFGRGSTDGSYYCDWWTMATGGCLATARDAYFSMMNGLFDQLQIGGTFWSSDPTTTEGAAYTLPLPDTSFGIVPAADMSPMFLDGTLNLAGQALQRAYPRAIAGTLNSYSFNRGACQFSMSYTTGSQSNQWTEVYLPSYCYSSNYRFSSNVALTQSYDQSRHVLKVMPTTPSVKPQAISFAVN